MIRSLRFLRRCACEPLDKAISLMVFWSAARHVLKAPDPGAVVEMLPICIGDKSIRITVERTT